MAKCLAKVMLLASVLAICVSTGFADTLVLKTGERISGFFEGGTPRIVKFRTEDGAVKDYDILTVQTVQFGNDKPASAPAASAPAASAPAASAPAPSVPAASSAPAPASEPPRLAPASERPPAKPVSQTAANSGWSVPTGSKIVVRMIDSISSEQNSAGQTFVATLEEPILVGGVEVVPKNADVRGRIAKIEEAGRISGSAQLGLELTQIYVNGIPYSMATSEYQQVGEARGAETAKRTGGGAAIGALIGAIAGGGKGAAIGAGVGAGGATAVQVLTKGEKLNIPSETKLEFTLRAPLVIAGK